MAKKRAMMSFDWAFKKLLRNKENFDVLEGFLSELLKRQIVVKNIVESESNQASIDDKLNRVDIMVEMESKELVIIELQFQAEVDYFQRIIFGTSKSIAERLSSGDAYSKVRKMYSIHVVYFDLGDGDDYVYHGRNSFKGVHTNTELYLTPKEREVYNVSNVCELFPEYYIIKVSKFKKLSVDLFDEWVYYLKTNKIGDDFTAKGIDKAREVLRYNALSEEEKREHDRLLELRRNATSVDLYAYADGLFEGREEGLKKGLKEGRKEGRKEGEVKGRREGLKEGLKEGEVKGRKEGLKEGLKEGEVKGLEKIVIRMHKKGKSIKDIIEATDLEQHNIQQILDKNK
jgi:predicted transposase/invertase (TIGR01784 family)